MNNPFPTAENLSSNGEVSLFNPEHFDARYKSLKPVLMGKVGRYGKLCAIADSEVEHFFVRDSLRGDMLQMVIRVSKAPEEFTINDQSRQAMIWVHPGFNPVEAQNVLRGLLGNYLSRGIGRFLMSAKDQPKNGINLWRILAEACVQQGKNVRISSWDNLHAFVDCSTVTQVREAIHNARTEAHVRADPEPKESATEYSWSPMFTMIIT